MFKQQGIVYFPLSSGQVLAIHPTMGIVIRLRSGAEPIKGIAQLTMKEVDVLLPLLHAYPACCTYGMLLASFYHGGNAQDGLVEKAERWLAEAADTQAWEQQMRPVKNTISRVCLGLQALGMDIAAVRGTGYVLLEEEVRDD